MHLVHDFGNMHASLTTNYKHSEDVKYSVGVTKSKRPNVPLSLDRSNGPDLVRCLQQAIVY